jgi:hypothetical protein
MVFWDGFNADVSIGKQSTTPYALFWSRFKLMMIFNDGLKRRSGARDDCPGAYGIMMYLGRL